MLRKSMFVPLLLSGCMSVPGVAMADGDAVKGAQVFKKCESCHALEPTNKVGPSLKGIVGRKAGAAPGYSYSSAMKTAGEGGLIWNEESLTQYLVAPQAMIPGIKMTFAGIKAPQDIANLIAYLKNQP